MALEQTQQTVRLARAVGIARPRRRLPQQLAPRMIELEYARALIAIVEATRAAFQPLMLELPGLLEAAQRERADDARADAGEGRRIQALIDAARARLASTFTTGELEALALRIASRTARHNQEQLGRQIKAALGVDVFASDRKLGAIVDGFVSENVALIKNIPDKIASDIGLATTRAITSGTLHGDLAVEITERIGMGITRAKLVARDQVGKLYGQINMARQRELGVDRYTWRTVQDRRVRGTPGGAFPNAVPSHYHRNGVEFSWSKPPAGGHPGEAILCRCWAEPDFSTILDDL